MAAAETAGFASGGGNPTAGLDPEGMRLVNMSVLQRMDPAVEEILVKAARVSLYDFDIAQNTWSHKDVEGSLFVVKRSGQPRFQFIIMNIRSTDNLVEDLLGDFEYELQSPYILYRNAAQEVNGIWFHNAKECEVVANLFSRILNAYSMVPTKPNIASDKSEEAEASHTQVLLECNLAPASSLVQGYSAVNSGTNVAPGGLPHQFSGNGHGSNHPPYATTAEPSILPYSHLQTSSGPFVHVNAHDSNILSINSTELGKPVLPSVASSSELIITTDLPTAPPLHPQTAIFPSPCIPISNSQASANPVPPTSNFMHHLFPLLNSSAQPTITPTYGPLVTKEGIRSALLNLVQKDAFVDMVYVALLAAQDPLREV